VTSVFKNLMLIPLLGLCVACSSNGVFGNQTVSFSSLSSSVIGEDGSVIPCRSEAQAAATVDSYACLFERPDFQGEACCVPRPSAATPTIRVPPENPRSSSTGSLRVRGPNSLGTAYCSEYYANWDDYLQQSANGSAAGSACTFNSPHVFDINRTVSTTDSSGHERYFGIKTFFFRGSPNIAFGR